MTNGDKIRSMSDEELGVLLMKENDNHLCVLEIFEKGASCRNSDCEKCIELWLKEESE